MGSGTTRTGRRMQSELRPSAWPVEEPSKLHSGNSLRGVAVGVGRGEEGHEGSRGQGSRAEIIEEPGSRAQACPTQAAELLISAPGLIE